ncbi:MAG: glycosyltransferase family 2 protein [Myxococcaceae bacterium]
MSPPELSVVVPVFNEEAILSDALDELVAALERRGRTFEIILAENGSTDGTKDILKRRLKKDTRIRAIHFASPNYGAALKRGIEAALGRWVICDEIDLLDFRFYDIALPKLAQGDADLIVGSKTAQGASDRRPFVRRLATRVHNGLLRILLGFRGTDTHGLKAFRREAMLPVVKACVVDRDVFASELVVRAWRMGLRVTEVPIQLEEKRKPSVALLRRIPHVLRQLAKLVYVIRVRASSEPRLR